MRGRRTEARVSRGRGGEDRGLMGGPGAGCPHGRPLLVRAPLTAAGAALARWFALRAALACHDDARSGVRPRWLDVRDGASRRYRTGFGRAGFLPDQRARVRPPT